MYEIWLGLNIIWELALGAWPWLVMGALAWLALLFAARGRSRANWRASGVISAALAVAGAVAAFFAMPALTGASFADMGYWVDWAVLAGMAWVAAVLMLLIAWPVLVMLRRSA